MSRVPSSMWNVAGNLSLISGLTMRRSLVFALNGERVELEAVDPRTTVLQYIRSQPSLQGTKLGCGEGGCGACTVLLSKYDATSKRVEELTINSCLALLCSIDGCAITTTEGLKRSKKDFHAIHRRLAGFHASQCGFCTPGMSMSIYGALRKASAKTAGIPTVGGQYNGHSAATCNVSSAGVPIIALDATNSISGNICRCTGYRPILDACKSFSGDVDVEDLGLNSFWGSKQKADAALLPRYDSDEDPKFPSFLIEELESRKGNSPPNSLSLEYEERRDATVKRQWITATSLANCFDILKKHNLGNNLDVQLVVGNTSAGVYKDMMRPQVYIHIGNIPELKVVKTTRESLAVGAAVPLTKLIGVLETESISDNLVYKELAKHVKQIASEQVRNRASLGGNLILAQKLGFDSDLATILLGAGAEVTVASAEGQSTIPVEEFLSQGGLEPGRILASVHIPSWNNFSKAAGAADAKLFFKTYRISCRPRGNAVAYINAAFLAVVDQRAQVITNLKLAFGAFGGPHAVRAGKTEKFLVGKSVSPAVLLEAIKTLKEEINPSSKVHKSSYRRSVAVGFFFDFFKSSLPSLNSKSTSVPAPDGDKFTDVHEKTENADICRPLISGDSSSQIPNMSNGTIAAGLTSSNGSPSNDEGLSNSITLDGGAFSSFSATSNREALSDGCANSVPKLRVVEFGTKTKCMVVNGKRKTSPTESSQKFVTSSEFWPVAQPTEKTGAHLQAAGEAVYVDDIAPVKGTLYAVFVLSDKGPGKIVSVDVSEALKSPGAVDFVGAKDIPGQNIGFDCFFCQDRLFAEDRVECVHDSIGVLVADSHENAREAASKVKVTVEEDEGSIYTIEDAIAKGSYGNVGIFAPAAVASFGENLVKGRHRIEEGAVYCGSQYHFYMETQTAYAVPDEDQCMTVYSANQCPAVVHKAVALSLGEPMNSVRVITRRLGGSFGGKMARASIIAVASAVAASKVNRPVKISLDRQTDMRMCMGRHEAKAIYTVDFNDDGKVVSLQANIFMNAGRSTDLSPIIIHGVMYAMRQYNWGTFRGEGKLCKTDQVSRALMRAPGDAQGHFIAETIVEHVAAYLGLDAWKVRERNMHSLETLDKYFPGSINSVDSYTLPHIVEKLKEQSQLEERKLAIMKFNEGSRWEKRGIDMVVCIYSTGTLSKQAKVSVCEDGSVVVEVGGVEMGQGLWTKVKQAVAYGLRKLWGPEAHPLERVDMSKIRVVQNDSISLPNSKLTAGSTSSEASCQAALLACESLVESLRPFLDNLRESGSIPTTWEAIIATADLYSACLTAHGNYSTGSTAYLNYGAAVSEVSINVLTGATTILQSDMLYDCGRSLNPAVDIGQIEGAFVMGVGFFLTEELCVEEGKLISTGTWDYKPPTADNIPQRFHVELSNMKPNRDRILSSKASGEPPVLLAKSVHSALRNAIAAARHDLLQLPVLDTNAKESDAAINVKQNAYFRLDSPAPIDKVKTLCGLDNVERYLASFQ